MANQSIVNIAAYQFLPLGDLSQLKIELLQAAQAHEIKGTIILSQEGMNLMLAGSRNAIDAYVNLLRVIPGLENLVIKESLSERCPFKRMRIKIKPHLIPFPKLQIKLEQQSWPAKRISPQEFKQWLDENRDITVLDTRNDYEIAFGTFHNAVDPHIQNFIELPDAVAELPPEAKQKPLVMFCTGGIRCEKAAPVLEDLGFKEVYQLEGGILQYFEECGDAHYDGACYVFDERVALTTDLAVSGLQQCEQCQGPVGMINSSEPQTPLSICEYCQV